MLLKRGIARGRKEPRLLALGYFAGILTWRVAVTMKQLRPVFSFRLTLRLSGPGWLAMRIAMLGVDFEVHEPPELIEHLKTVAGRLKRGVS